MSGVGVVEVRRRARLLLAGGVVLLVVAASLAWWQSAEPEALPVSDDVVAASTKVDSPVYVGVFTADAGFDRTLHLSGVKVRATSNTDVSLTPLLCRGGNVGVTTDPRAFCTELVDPEGQTLRAGDGIVLQVVHDEPAVAVIEQVRLAFRENLRWATSAAGSSAVVRILPG